MSREDVAIILTFTIVIVLAVICGIGWHVIDHIKSKRPHKSDDEEDNPITKFKDDLADIYEGNPNSKLKKLAQAVWNRVEEIEKWHNAEIHDWERKYYSAKYSVGELDVKCDGYREELDEWTQRCEELQSKLNESQERLKRESAKVKTLESETDKLRDMLRKAAEAKAKTQPDYLIGENTFPGQINPFSKVAFNTGEGKPLTATEATDLAERLMNTTSQPIVMDSETLNETQVKNEEFLKQLRDWWGLDADTNKWPDFMMKVNCVPKEWNRYRVTVRNKCGATSTVHEWAPNPWYFINKFNESNYTVLSYDLDNPVYRGEESTT